MFNSTQFLLLLDKQSTSQIVQLKLSSTFEDCYFYSLTSLTSQMFVESQLPFSLTLLIYLPCVLEANWFKVASLG